MKQMLDKSQIPTQLGGGWIDVYNQCVNTEVAGTVNTRINRSDHYWVTEPTPTANPTARAMGQAGTADGVLSGNNVELFRAKQLLTYTNRE